MRLADRAGFVTGGAGLTALDVDRVHAELSSVPVQIFDLEGALLAEAAAPTTRDAAMPSDADVLVLILQGRELPGFGPTSVPTLARLGRTPVVDGNGKPDTAVPPPEDREPEEAPSGSALSTLDAVTLFGEAARRQFAARG